MTISAKHILGPALLGLCAAVLGLSFVHPWGNLRSAAAATTESFGAPGDVRQLMVRSCGDCHSDRTRWPLYSHVAPASWLVERDVNLGREHMNLSRWSLYTIEERVDLLSKISTQLRLRQMPLKQYLLLHPEARLSDSERKLIIDWAKSERRRLNSQGKETTANDRH